MKKIGGNTNVEKHHRNNTTKMTTISREHREWIDYLCEYGDEDEFDEILDQSKSAVFAIMKYRRLLKTQGIGEIPFDVLNTALTQNNYIRLHNLLQELFMEMISNEQFEYIIDKINNSENGLLKLYDRHEQDSGERIVSIALTLDAHI